MVVVEAASMGVPSIVAAAPDNAAVEHIEEGVNGFAGGQRRTVRPGRRRSARRSRPRGPRLRDSTADWFAAQRAAS